jgi:hypothetical protein
MCAIPSKNALIAFKTKLKKQKKKTFYAWKCILENRKTPHTLTQVNVGIYRAGWTARDYNMNIPYGIHVWLDNPIREYRHLYKRGAIGFRFIVRVKCNVDDLHVVEAKACRDSQPFGRQAVLDKVEITQKDWDNKKSNIE